MCPSLYWLWSISKDPKSFSEAFLLSINCPSGMELGFKMRYLLNVRIIRQQLPFLFNAELKLYLFCKRKNSLINMKHTYTHTYIPLSLPNTQHLEFRCSPFVRTTYFQSEFRDLSKTNLCLKSP